MKKLFFVLMLALCLPVAALAAEAKKIPLEAWQPKFDPSGAEYTYMLSNVSHPVIEGVGAGYRIRDKVWEKSGGRLYVDFRPLSQLGGEKDVLNKTQAGCHSRDDEFLRSAANVSDVLGIVNLPDVVDTFAKLDKFRYTPELWQPFAEGALQQGIRLPTSPGTVPTAGPPPPRSRP